jgi:hypothetical protein
MIDSKTCKVFNYLIWKIGDHPAAPSRIFPTNHLIDYTLQEVDSHGLTDWANRMGVDVWYSAKNYKKYKTEFDKELSDIPDGDPCKPNLVKIQIPYIDFYGIPYKVDHVEYWGEIHFKVFKGNDFSDKKCFDPNNWDGFCGYHCSALSYEEMVIKLIRLFFKNLGSALDDGYLTKEEKINHAQFHRFTRRDAKDKKGYYLDKNKNYISVNEAEINRRWLKEFVKTDYGKKHWGDYFNGIIQAPESK